MRDLINLSDDQINEIFADEFNFDRDGDCCFLESSGVDFTNDTIEQFLTNRKTWNKPGHLETGTTEIGGFPYLQIEDCQAVKGQEKINLIVVDFGPVRVVYQ